MRVALVLGAGGLVGVAHHVGVLRALEREAGFAPDDADLLVGTSAGAVIAAYVRAGWSTEQLWERAAALRQAAPAGAAAGPMELARRLVGSSYVVARSALPVPASVVVPRVPRAVRRLFPAGLFTLGAAPRLLASDLPATWPERALYLCAVDVESGRREMFGRPGAPPVPLARAVLASCAIPGVYPPVPAGGRAFVDGGVHSLTNLDLAAEAGTSLTLCVAPMAYDLTGPPPRAANGVVRLWPTVTLRAEVRAARRAGTQVVVLAPGPSEVRVHGWNLMRGEGLRAVALAAYDATARAAATSRLGDMLSGDLVDLDGRRSARRRQGRGSRPMTALRAWPPTGGTRATTR